MAKRDRWTWGDAPDDAPFLPTMRTVRLQDVTVVYQPVFDLHTGASVGAEALLRAQVPELGTPRHLVAAAVSQRAMGRLGRVLRHLAVKHAAGWPLFVNVHLQELESRWFVRPDDPLTSYEGPVRIELAQSAFLARPRLARASLAEVCGRCDAEVVVDDLVLGPGRLRQVLAFKPSMVKLQRLLVADLDESRSKQLLLRGLVDTCHELGARVAVKGIERIEQLRAAYRVGVDYAQGFLLARPGRPPAVKSAHQLAIWDGETE